MGDSVPPELEQHLRGPCRTCRERATRYEGFLEALADARPEPVPEAWIRRASRLERGRDRALGRLALIVAELLSPARPVPAFRSGAPGRVVQFHGEGFDIDLAILRSGALLGHVVPGAEREERLESGECTLYGPHDARWTSFGADGEFRFEHVEPGDYSLVVESGEVCIVVPEVALEAPPDAPGG